MHDDDNLKLAEQFACDAVVNDHKYSNAQIRDDADLGGIDLDHPAVQSAIAAINALDQQLVEAVGLLREIEDQFRFYGDNHAAKPDPVKAKTNYDWADRISAFLAKQGMRDEN